MATFGDYTDIWDSVKERYFGKGNFNTLRRGDG
jgi:hypothetical protein